MPNKGAGQFEVPPEAATPGDSENTTIRIGSTVRWPLRGRSRSCAVQAGTRTCTPVLKNARTLASRRGRRHRNFTHKLFPHATRRPAHRHAKDWHDLDTGKSFLRDRRPSLSTGVTGHDFRKPNDWRLISQRL